MNNQFKFVLFEHLGSHQISIKNQLWLQFLVRNFIHWIWFFYEATLKKEIVTVFSWKSWDINFLQHFIKFIKKKKGRGSTRNLLENDILTIKQKFK